MIVLSSQSPIKHRWSTISSFLLLFLAIVFASAHAFLFICDSLICMLILYFYPIYCRLTHYMISTAMILLCCFIHATQQKKKRGFFSLSCHPWQGQEIYGEFGQHKFLWVYCLQSIRVLLLRYAYTALHHDWSKRGQHICLLAEVPLCIEAMQCILIIWITK